MLQNINVVSLVLELYDMLFCKFEYNPQEAGQLKKLSEGNPTITVIEKKHRLMRYML